MDNTIITKSICFRQEIRFTHEWSIHDFNCEEADEGVNLPSTNFVFQLKNGMEYSGKLSLTGKTCQKRQIVFALKCTNRSFWKVKFYLTLDGGDHLMDYLNQDDDSKWFRLGDGVFNHNGRDNHAIKVEVLHVEYKQNLDPSFPVVKNSKTERQTAFVELFKSQEFWDVTFEVGDQKLRAYKGILASRSKVFADMFKKDNKEAELNKVTIDDIEFDVFEKIIRFLYTGEVENMKDMALKIFAASDKFGLENLKTLCAKELATNISSDTAADILILADLHAEKKLKEISINFINNNKKAVADTEGWRKILKNYPHLLGDLYIFNN